MTRRAGFTLIELVVVVTVVVILTGFGGLYFSDYFQQTSARRAAQVFAQDLVAARSFAVRSQEAVVIRFYESGRWYQVESQSTSTEIARRSFGGNGDIDLSALALDLMGDTLLFDTRGVADMSGTLGSLGTARFSSGAVTYTVSFNGMGASKIDRT